MQEKTKKKMTARGVKNNPSAVIKAGMNHRGEPTGRRYAIIPSRAVAMAEMSPNEFLVLAALGLFVSRQGVSFPTYQTIENLTGLGNVQITAALRRLINHGLIRKLQPKRYPKQRSKWLTSRYQVLFMPNDPLPTDEELEASIPFATDSPDTYQDKDTYAQVEKKTNQIGIENDEKTIGIERELRSISQTYGYTISTDTSSLNQLAALNPSRDRIAMAFKTYVTRFGSLPTTLRVLLDRGVFA